MNLIFTIIFLVSVAVFAVFSPDGALKAVTDGGKKAVALSVNLIAIYSVWSGILQIAEDSGLIKKLSKRLSPLLKRLFKNPDEKTTEYLSVNIGANMLGMGGIATPAGIAASKRLCDSGNYDGANRLFVLASTSLQIIPTTVIALRQTFSSAAPAVIFLPSLLSSLVCTAVGLALSFIFGKR